MGWVKDESGCMASGDGSGRTAQMRFLLGGGEDPVAICNNPTAFMGGETGNEPLPARNSIHPLDTGMHLDSYDIETDGAVAVIVAKFSTDGRFRFPNTSGSTRWKCSFQDIVFDIPFAQKVKELVGRGLPIPPNGQGPPQPGLPTYSYKWDYKRQRVLGKVQKVSITFPVKPIDVIPLMDAIYVQQDCVQLINGKFWLFEGGDINDGPRADDYECNLNWYRETGVVIDEGDEPLMRWPHNMPTRIQGMSAPASPARDWSQAPFHRTVIKAPVSGKADDPPTFASILQYDVNLTGYAQLAQFIPPFT